MIVTGITAEALTWALEQLRDWATATPPGKRVKQVVYRLLLLRELGADAMHREVLSTGDFKRHCRRFLLVSNDSLAPQTAGIQQYFVPLTCEYQRASGSSVESTDWAIGTMWTRCQTWKSQGIINFDSVTGTQGSRQIQFEPDYDKSLETSLDKVPLPALPLAIFLLRDPSTTDVDLNAVTTPQELLDVFIATFKLSDPDVLRLFNLDVSGFSGTLTAGHTMSGQAILDLIKGMFPFETSLAEESLGSTDPAIRYEIEDEDKKGHSDRPVQLLLHGCPGSGKSYLLRLWSREVSKTITVVFHPETSYADFVGVYRPYPLFRAEPQTFIDEAGRSREHGEPYVTYEFVAGPFIDAYCYARKNPSESVALIIEELSRANASLVFGDMLQLLDRATESDGDFRAGESIYSINPKPEVAGYLVKHGIGTDEGGRIRFPSNLHIWATMNRSDQNARQLDSAFLRRWKKEYLSYVTASTYGTVAVEVPGGTLAWDTLRERINSKLIGIAPEDKFIGPYFLTSSTLVDRQSVAEDLLGYLWNDVLKARARDFFSRDTFAEVRQAWIEQTENPFKDIDLT